jgi:His Kinase A (phospho-acceptor) domain
MDEEMSRNKDNGANGRAKMAFRVLVCGDPEFCAEASRELQRRQSGLDIAAASGLGEARRKLQTGPTAVILAEERVLLQGEEPRANGHHTLQSAVEALLAWAPVVIIGSAAHQLELKAVLAAGQADFVARSAMCLPVALGMVERRLRQQRAGFVTQRGATKTHPKPDDVKIDSLQQVLQQTCGHRPGTPQQTTPQQIVPQKSFPPQSFPQKSFPQKSCDAVLIPGNDEGVGETRTAEPEAPAEERDFGEVLRHELNNPLTGILGNAELLLVEFRRAALELPPKAKLRLETIAALAVRMRETVRQLSEEWESQGEAAPRETMRLSG